MATEIKTTAKRVDSPASTGSVSLEPTKKATEAPAHKVTVPEPTAPEATPLEVTTPEATAAVGQSLVIAHLQSYPTVNAAYNYAASFSLVQRISNKAIPIFEAVREKSRPISDPIIKRASPILERADKLGDDILSRVDDKIPQLKTTEPQEVIDIARRPVETVISTAEAYSTAARDRFTVRIVKPIQDATENVKVQYASVYDSKGKPLIKTRVDPLLLPLNEKFEAFINFYLPKGEDVSKYENELARTVQLAIAAVKRARPVIDEKATQLKALPKETRAHVQEVYEKQRGEYADKSPVSSTIYASLATWKQISSEGVTYAGAVLHLAAAVLKLVLSVSLPGGVAIIEIDAPGLSTCGVVIIEIDAPGLTTCGVVIIEIDAPGLATCGVAIIEIDAPGLATCGVAMKIDAPGLATCVGVAITEAKRTGVTEPSWGTTPTQASTTCAGAGAASNNRRLRDRFGCTNDVIYGGGNSLSSLPASGSDTNGGGGNSLSSVTTSGSDTNGGGNW